MPRALFGGILFDGRDTVRTPTRVTLVLAALAAFSANEARGQAHLSLSVGVGPLFTGVSFGISGGHYAPGSVFAGSVLGFGHRSPYNDYAYGLYSESYDGWDRGYHGNQSSYSCWDYYWDSYWDSYADWFYDCVAYRPWRYNSFRTRSWFGRRGGHWGLGSTFVFLRDPFSNPWGPYWDYDPWGGYWGGSHWGGGYLDRYYGGYGGYGGYYGSYYGGGRTPVVLNRPSPLLGGGYKENPRTATGRAGARRRGTTTTAATPAQTPARAGTDTGRRARPSSVPAADRAGTRTARPGGAAVAPPRRAGGTLAAGRPSGRLTGRTGTRAATPRQGAGSRRPSTPTLDGVRPSTRSGDTSTRSRQSSRLPSRNPVVRPRTTRSSSPRASSGNTGRSGTRATPGRAPSTRRAPTRTPTARSAPSRTPTTRSAAPSRGSTRSAPSRAPSTRSAPSRGSSTRSAPSRAPSTRSAPSRAPRTRSAPSRAPSTRSAPSRAPSTRSAPRSAPRAQAKPPSRSSRGTSSRPTRRRGG